MTTTKRKAARRIVNLYDDWQQAQARLQMALTTLYGAQADVLSKEIAFKAATQLHYGAIATFEHSEKGLVIVVPAVVSKVPKRG